MIRVLLVDDEEWTRISIREQSDWGALGIEIYGEAKNGKAAWEMICSDPPHIVITDIRMPIMDGIQLLEQIHQQFPQILVIVLSGYSEFEYAKKALAFQAFDYVLKPIEVSAMEATLQRAVAKLHDEKSKKEDLISLNIQLNASSSLSREKFLTNLILGTNLSLDKIRNNLAKRGIQIAGSKFVILVIQAENFQAVAELRYKNDTELTSFVMTNVIEELFEDYQDALLFRKYGRNNELILIKGLSLADDRVLLEEIYAKSRSIIHKVEELTRFKLKIGIGREFTSLKDSRYSYEQALEAIQQAGIVHKDTIIHFDEVSNRNEYFVYPDDKEKAFIYYLENGYKQQVDKLMDELFLAFSDSTTISPRSVRNTVLELTVSIQRLLKKNNVQLEHFLNHANLSDKIWNELHSIHELKEWLGHAAKQAMDLLTVAKKTGSKKSIAEIVSYLNEYYDEEISLQAVADTFFLNPAYLSRIFKNETGKTFNQYLSDVRMQAAVRLLLNSQLKIVEISSLVGYENVSYFVKKFKEHFECTPSEYREGLR